MQAVKFRSPLRYMALGLLAMTASSGAHHGTFTFDGDSVIALEGTVVEFQWTNPHGSLVFDVAQADGSTRRYVAETDGPSILTPLGVTRDSLQPGDYVLVYASPARDPEASTVLGREALTANGDVLGLSVAYTRRMDPANLPVAESVTGTWVPDKDALFAFVRNRDDWPLTEKGADSLAAYDIRAPFSQTECIPVTSPTLLMYPTAKVLTGHADHIEMQIDWMGASRTLFTDGRSHPDVDTRFLQGHSTAVWEGKTLVIDTRNFAENPMGNAFGIDSGTGKHLQERLELSDDGRSLTYHFTLSDPEYLAEPVSGSATWHHRPDVRLSPVECSIEEASRHLSDQ